MKTLWLVTYHTATQNHRYELEADGLAAAILTAHRDLPDTVIDTITPVTVLDALNAYDSIWNSVPEPSLEFDTPATETGDSDAWLTLNFATALDTEGRILPAGIANFRYLQRMWGASPALRFDGGRVRIRAHSAAPASFIEVVSTVLDFGGAIDRATDAAVRAELGLAEDASTRVAVRDGDGGGWRIVDCPIEVLGDDLLEASAIAEHVPEGTSWEPNVIVVDAVPGYTAGCSTWSMFSGEERDWARAEHVHCQHGFRPAWLRQHPGLSAPRPLFTHVTRTPGIDIQAPSITYWVCDCGNRSDIGGFVACDAVGNPIEPTADACWARLRRCTECHLVLDERTYDDIQRTVQAVGWARHLV